MNRLWVRLALAFCLIFVLVFIGLGTTLNFSADPSLLADSDFNDEQIEAFTFLFETGALQQVLRWQASGGVIFVTVVMLAAGLFSGIWASYWLTKPLNSLGAAARAIGKRDLSQRVEVTGSREIAELGDSFNEMAEALESAENRRQNLLADVAHELRTPLTVLQSNLRAILDGVYSADQAQIATLYDQTRHLHHLVNDLHDLAQAEAHKLPLNLIGVDLIALVQQAGAIFDPLAQEDGIDLRVITPDVLPIVRGDRARLIQVLQNLLANALRYAEEQITLCLWREGSSAYIEISDDGIGIAPEHLPHIFDRFYRTDPSRTRNTGGTGLGLAIAHAIITAHNGAISVTSNGVGQGITVAIQLPLH